MSSTSNVQDLLVNVFRPTYRYDSNVGFVPSLVLSNVSEVITDRLRTGAFTVSDSNRNTFIGESAGANASSNGCVENVALGYGAMAGAVSSSNNTSFGYSNFVGLLNANSNVGIGASVTMGRGRKNILIGPNVSMGDGSGNIIIGSDISVGNVSRRLQLGTLLYGDLSSGFFGVNTSQPKAAFDISGTTVFRGKVGFQVEEPKYSLDVAGSIYSTERFFGGLGTVAQPVYSFEDASTSGMYVPSGYGTGAFAIATNGAPTAVFASNSVYFFQDLDVSGTFSACNVVLSAFSVQNGTAATPTITFANDQSSGFFLVSPSNVGFTTDGARRMVLLANGDLSMGRALVSDISASGAIFSSAGSNNIGGVTLSNGNVILTGVATNTNLLVPGWFRDTDPATNLDISGGNISNSLTTRSSNFRGSTGTAGRPTYSFVSDPSTGVHLVNGSALGFDTSGVLRMCLSGGFLGIGTATPRVALDVSGDISANVYNGPGGTEGAPHYTFSDDRTTGLFFPGANIVGLTAGGTERMRISNSNIGIGTKAPANALDVSGTLRVIGTAGDITFTNGAISVAGVPVISSTGVLSNGSTTSNSIGGVTLSNSDLCMGSTARILAPIVRNALTPSTYDISGGNISNSGVHTTTGLVGAYLRNALTPSTYDVSGGNLWYTGSISNATVSASNVIGGVTLSNQDISLSATGRILGVATNSNRIGGVTLSNFDLSMASTGRILAPILRDAVTPSTYDISGGNISNSGTLTSTNAIISGYIRNALTPITYDISGGNISNSGTTRSSNFIGTVNSASNLLGGVTLSNFDLSMTSTGRILAPILRNALTPSTYDISGGNISNSGLHISSNFRGSNGTAAVPTYSFTNDPATGLHLVNASTLGFDTAGVQQMCISGNFVGIGTPAPAAILDISIANPTGVIIRNSGLTLSNQNAYGSLKIRGNGNQNMAYIEDAGGATYNGWMFGTDTGSLGSATRLGLHRITNGNIAFSTLVIDACTGAVGLGTTAPSTRLDVTGRTRILQDGSTNPATTNTQIADTLILQSTANYDVAADQNKAVSLLFTNSSTSANYPQARIASEMLSVNPTGFFGNLIFQTTESAGLRERMRIHSNGNVGIGTVGPTTALDVCSSAVTGLTVRQGTATGIGLQVTNGTRSVDLGVATAAGAWAANSIVGDAVLRTTAAGRLLFNATGTANAALTISGDYVGVGCTNTGGGLIYLDVCGATRISRNINGNNNLILIADSSTGTPVVRHGISIFNTAGTANVGGDLAFNTYDNAGLIIASPALMIKRSNGAIGINCNAPAYQLDVNGTIRGSSNVVAMASSNWSVGTFTAYTDTSFTIPYTPKQTTAPNVRLQVSAGFELQVGSGTGSDFVTADLRNNATILSAYTQTFTDQTITTRGTGNLPGGRMAVLDVCGNASSLINLRINRGGDDIFTYRNVYLSIAEISTT